MSHPAILHVATPHHEQISPIEGMCRLIQEINAQKMHRQALAVFWQREYAIAREILGADFPIYCYEAEASSNEFPTERLTDLERHFPAIHWGPLIASEREFSDYSFLLGATGLRTVSAAEAWRHTAGIGLFLDRAFEESAPDAVLTVVADNIFNMIATALAEARDLDVIIPQFVQLAGPGRATGGFLGRTRYLDSFRFIRAYEKYRMRALTEEETGRAHDFEKFLLGYDLVATHKALGTAKLRSLPVSPRWRSILSRALWPDQEPSAAEYRRWSFGSKLAANAMRILRFKQLEKLLAQRNSLPAGKCVFFPMHFQPEASTLVNGLFWSNQIAAIEQISKSLPLGYVLAVKEHEKGRGSRPIWQYRHIESLYNVRLVDLPAKEIISRCDALVTISGTAAVEAVAQRKPVIVLGNKHYYYPEFFLRPRSAEDLPALLKDVLVLGKHRYDDHELHAFYLGWMDAQFEVVPSRERFHELAPEIIAELEQDYSVEKVLLGKRMGAPVHEPKSQV